MFERPSLAVLAVLMSSQFAQAGDIQEFPVAACTTDNVSFANVLKVKTIGDREMPAGIQGELDNAWQATLLEASAADVESIGAIWSRYHNAIGQVAGRHGVTILAVPGGLQRQDQFCFQPIGKPA